MLTAFVLVGIVAGSPAGPTASPVEPAPWTEMAPHAVRGIVTKIDATSLVIRTTTSKPIDLLFVLTASTLTDGLIAIGSTVSVRYRVEGSSRVATAVRVRVPKLVADPWEATRCERGAGG